jgi:ABC-type multidrug transport system ATPase subunit/ABC-type multidrug transport system permease subunit
VGAAFSVFWRDGLRVRYSVSRGSANDTTASATNTTTFDRPVMTVTARDHDDDPVGPAAARVGSHAPTMLRPGDANIPALVAQDLVKVYPGGAVGLAGLQLTVPQGSFFGLLGPNGAGKTTLIGAAAGLVRVAPGQLFIFGHDAAADAGAVRLLLGLAPQEVHLDRFLTSRELLVYHGRYFGMTARDAEARARELLATFDLLDKAEVRPNRLSGGMRRRLLIARALVHRPPLVVLDEPTAGVDLELRHELWAYLRRLHREEDATILLTTHYLEEAEALCEQIAFIRSGRIVAEGTPEDLGARYGTERLEDVYLTLMNDDSVDEGSGVGGAAPVSGHGKRSPEARRMVAVPDLLQVQRRGMVALGTREVRRVLVLWSQTIVPPVLNAVIYLLVFGGALGARLKQVEGVPYLSFIVPGLLVMTVSGQAFGNNSTTIFQAKYEGYIEDVLSSPITPWRMALAYTVGGLVRAFIVGALVFAVAAPFFHGQVNVPAAIAALTFTGVLFACLGVVTGIWAENFDQLSFVANLVIAPLSLVAGVFYSAQSLPGVWRAVTRLDPIYYLVTAARTGFLGLHEESLLVSLTVAAGVGGAIYLVAVWLLRRGWRLKP